MRFPGVREQVFRQLLYYIYTDDCPEVTPYDCVELLELANRLCLPRLISLVENKIVKDLKSMSEAGNDITEIVVHLLEPCQVSKKKVIS